MKIRTNGLDNIEVSFGDTAHNQNSLLLLELADAEELMELLRAELKVRQFGKFKATLKVEQTTPLYTFRWISAAGGMNQVWARSKTEAMAIIAKDFPGLNPDLTSFKRLSSLKAQSAYWKTLPLMD